MNLAQSVMMRYVSDVCGPVSDVCGPCQLRRVWMVSMVQVEIGQC